MQRFLTISPLLAVALMGAAGCGGAVETRGAAVDGQRYLLSAEPTGARSLTEIADDDEVVVVGRIGRGSPWVDGMAAFLVEEVAAEDCPDATDAPCPLGGDDCCPGGGSSAPRALVKIVDDQGRPLPVDARQLLGLREQQIVVVRGRAEHDDAGNLSIAAQGLYVRSE